MIEWMGVIVQGILLGGLYALFAAGLSLMFGVMRLVNIAHGDLIVLAAYIALTTTLLLGAHPFVALIIVMPLSSLETSSIALGPLSVGVFPLLTFVIAVVLIAFLQWVFYRTSLGREFRAVSDNQQIAQLMGLNKAHVFGLAMALAFAVTAIAGVLLGIRTSFDPSIGGGRLIFAFEAVIIGGLGSLWGTLAGGVILGVAQTVGGKIDPGWQVLAGHIAFLIVLAFKPKGLFPRVEH